MPQIEFFTLPPRPVRIGIVFMLYEVLPPLFRGTRTLGREPKKDCYGKPMSWCTEGMATP